VRAPAASERLVCRRSRPRRFLTTIGVSSGLFVAVPHGSVCRFTCAEELRRTCVNPRPTAGGQGLGVVMTLWQGMRRSGGPVVACSYGQRSGIGVVASQNWTFPSCGRLHGRAAAVETSRAPSRLIAMLHTAPMRPRSGSPSARPVAVSHSRTVASVRSVSGAPCGWPVGSHSRTVPSSPVPALTSARQLPARRAGSPRSSGGNGSSPRRSRVVSGGLVSEWGMVAAGDLSQVQRDRVVRAEYPVAALQRVVA
jgi:hypothetical protein